ncbi:MAG: tripartite tricarboxylate transporter substrate binding protein [Burkholderiales bacterium]|nr:tripartite tricarboxylate transporter substrate binding protein [Burkholderiales bacterium]
MANRRVRLRCAVAFSAALAAGGAPLPVAHAAGAYPSKPIRIIVNASPGGAPDILSRALGQKMTESTGQPIVIDARPGGGGVIAGEIAARALPDGYTVVMTGASMFGALPVTRKRLPFDPFKDFAPITLVADAANIVVVPPSLAVKNVAGLIELARTTPVLFASAGMLTPAHLGGELLNALAGLKMTHVAYKGAGPALVDLISGQVQVFITSPVSAAPHLQSGRLRALATTGTTRTAAHADLPTVAETVPGYEITQWWGLAVPAATPVAIRARLHEETAKALRAPELRARFASQGAAAGGGSPQQLAEFMQAELARTRKIVQMAGIPIEQ